MIYDNQRAPVHAAGPGALAKRTQKEYEASKSSYSVSLSGVRITLLGRAT